MRPGRPLQRRKPLVSRKGLAPGKPLGPGKPLQRRTPLRARAPLPPGAKALVCRKRMRVGRKPPTAAEKRHMGRVAALGCIVCWLEDHVRIEAEVHHLRTGVGMGQRSPHWRVIPLCPSHHREGKDSFHTGQGGSRGWQERHGSELVLLVIVLALLEEHGVDLAPVLEHLGTSWEALGATA